MFRKLYRWEIVFLFIIILFPPFTIHAEDNASGEYRVKAAFIYNIAKFVEWPAEKFNGPKNPLVLSIRGENPFGSALESIENKNVRGRKLYIRLNQETLKIENVHILFISPSQEKDLQKILSRIKGRSILTVSDMKSFARRGGMVHLARVGNKVQLRINSEALKRSGLKISSQILKLAEIVTGPSENKEDRK